MSALPLREPEEVTSWPEPVTGRALGWRVRFTNRRERISGLAIAIGHDEMARLKAGHRLEYVEIGGTPAAVQAVTIEKMRSRDPRCPEWETPVLWALADQIEIAGQPASIVGLENDNRRSGAADYNDLCVDVRTSARAVELERGGPRDIGVKYLGRATRGYILGPSQRAGRVGASYVALADPAHNLGLVEITNASPDWRNGRRVRKEQP